MEVKMLHNTALTTNDDAILSQLFDPEAAPAAVVVVDPSMPPDPHINDPDILALIRSRENEVVKSCESALRQPKGSIEREEVLSNAYSTLSALIETYPMSGSLRNNRTQVFRLQHGANNLVLSADTDVVPQWKEAVDTAISDLTTAISLLSPESPQSAISPAQGRTLAQSHTQRGAIYHAASKTLSSHEKDGEPGVRLKVAIKGLTTWTAIDFAEAASKDFFMGGRYGNGIGKALAVHINPTAKLCGQMVQDAMKREFESATATMIKR